MTPDLWGSMCCKWLMSSFDYFHKMMAYVQLTVHLNFMRVCLGVFVDESGGYTRLQPRAQAGAAQCFCLAKIKPLSKKYVYVCWCAPACCTGACQFRKKKFPAVTQLRVPGPRHHLSTYRWIKIKLKRGRFDFFVSRLLYPFCHLFATNIFRFTIQKTLASLVWKGYYYDILPLFWSNRASFKVVTRAIGEKILLFHGTEILV